MAASSTALANLALAKIGQERLENLSDTDDATVRWAAELYPHARDFVTELRLWRYCKKTQALTSTSNDRDSDFAYAYERPSDCFKLHRILSQYGAFDPQNPIRFDCEGDVIYTDEPDARGVYCRQITDTTKFPPSIDNAMAWYLAHILVQPLRQENGLLRTTLEGFNNAVAHAAAMGAVEEGLSDIRSADEAMADWHRGR